MSGTGEAASEAAETMADRRSAPRAFRAADEADEAAERGTGAGPAVLLVAYHFAPENTSGTHRPLHFARSLLEAGWDVQVLTVTEDELERTDPTLSAVFPHPERIHRTGKRRTFGEYYLALKRLLHRRGGAPAHESEAARDTGMTDAGAEAPRSFLRRQLSAWDAYPDRHKGWLPDAVAAGVRLGRRTPFAAVVASGPPWTALLAGAAIARRLGVPFVADFRDPWTPQLGVHHWYAEPWLRRRAERAEAGVIRQAELLLFNSPAVLETSRRSYPEPQFPPRRMIYNGSDAVRRETALAFPVRGPLVIRHFGTLYRGRSIAPLRSALETLVHAGELAADEVVIELIGSNEALEPARADAPPIAVREAGTVPHAEALRLMLEPALLLLVQPENFGRQIPTKLFEYLCTGNPVLVLAGADSAAAATARDYGRATLLDERDPAAMAQALRALVRRWRAGELMQERTVEDTAALTKRAVGEAFVRTLEELVAAQSRR